MEHDEITRAIVLTKCSGPSTMVHDLARTSSRVEKKDERYSAFNVAPLREYKIKLKDEFSYDQMLIIDLIDRQIVAISDERFSNVPPYL